MNPQRSSENLFFEEHVLLSLKCCIQCQKNGFLADNILKIPFFFARIRVQLEQRFIKMFIEAQIQLRNLSSVKHTRACSF